MERVFVAFSNGSLDTRVFPQCLDGLQKILWHLFFGTYFVFHQDMRHVFLNVSRLAHARHSKTALIVAETAIV